MRQNNANGSQIIPSPPKVETPELPFIFQDIPDQKYFHIGEAALTGCIRDALKVAGRDRWHELTSNGGWTDFLIDSRGHGLLGHDSNYDGNDLSGLLDWVKTLAIHDNPKLDLETNDNEKCASLVSRFATEDLLDEVILSWAVDKGHFKNLPPTKPQPQRRHVISDGEEDPTVIRVGHGEIVVYPEGAQARGNTTSPGNPPLNFTTHGNWNWTVFDNSTLHAHSTTAGILTRFIDQLLHEHPTGRFNSTFPANSTVHGKEASPGKWKIRYEVVVSDVSPFHGNSTLLANSTALNSTGHPDSLLSGRSTRSFNATFLANWTSHGRPLVRRSFPAAASVDEIVEEVDEDVTEAVKVASLADPEILKIFGKDADRLKSFFDQPVIRDLVYATTKKEHHKHHKHGKHGHHGKKEDSVWTDPKFVMKFIKDSVQGVKNSAQIVGGIAQVAEHNGDSKP